MTDASNGNEGKTSLRDVPALPHGWVAMWPVVLVGTGLWVLLFVVAGASWLASAGPPSEWFWTTVAGIGISLFGMSIMLWQRAANRRGTRAAQRSMY